MVCIMFTICLPVCLLVCLTLCLWPSVIQPYFLYHLVNQIKRNPILYIFLIYLSYPFWSYLIHHYTILYAKRLQKKLKVLPSSTCPYMYTRRSICIHRDHTECFFGFPTDWRATPATPATPQNAYSMMLLRLSNTEGNPQRRPEFLAHPWVKKRTAIRISSPKNSLATGNVEPL